MRRRTKVLLVLLLVVGLASPWWYDWLADGGLTDLYYDANPTASPRYHGGFLDMWALNGSIRAVVNFKTSVHDLNYTYELPSYYGHPEDWRHGVGPGFRDYWLVEVVWPGPDRYERVDLTIFLLAEWEDASAVCEFEGCENWLREPRHMHTVGNATAIIDWHGWI